MPAQGRLKTAADPGFLADRNPVVRRRRFPAGTASRPDWCLAHALSFACDRRAIAAALAELAAANPAGVHRVRLTLGRAGDPKRLRRRWRRCRQDARRRAARRL